MKLYFVLALCFSAALAAPGNGPKVRSSKIVGGQDTSIDKWPFMVSMLYNWWGIIEYQACGGALITSQTVLSASHCYIGDAASEWRIRVGTNLPESGGTVHSVNRIILHEQYNNNQLDYDVAVLRLTSPVTIGTSVATALIAGDNYRLPAGSEVWSIGWGTLWSGGPAANVLQEVDLDVIDHTVCADRYWELKQRPGYGSWPDVTARMMCTGKLDVGGKDACQGDSGGPIVHNGNVVVGIVSWGFGCADAYFPGVVADVAELSAWIVQNGSA